MNVELLIHATGWTLIHSLWIGVAAWLLFRLPQLGKQLSTQAAYNWGLTCLLLMVLALVFTFDQHWQSGQLLANERAIEAAEAALPVPGSAGPVIVNTPAPAPSTIDAVLPVLVLFWALAVLFLGARLARAQWALRRLVRASVSLPDLQVQVDELADKLGVRRSVAVLSSACAKAPFVFGYFAPVIVLPAAVASGLPFEQMRLVLAHELAHLRRYDYLVNWLQIGVETLLFYHPAVRILNNDIRRLREACCDDLALRYGNRKTYATALLALADYRNGDSVLAPSAVAGGLLWRIQRIAGAPSKDRRSVGRTLLPLAALLTVFAATPMIQPQGPALRDVELRALELIAATPARIDRPATAGIEHSVPPLAPAQATPVERISVVQPAPLAAAAPPIALQRSQPATVRLQPTDAFAAVLPDVAPLVSVAPRYPRGVAATNVVVEASYQVNGAGRVDDVRILNAAPRAFADNVAHALRQWQFPASGERFELRHRFEFRAEPDAGSRDCQQIGSSKLCVVSPRTRPASVLDGARCSQTTGSRMCRGRD